MKLLLLLLIVIVCISNFNFIYAAPKEMVFKIIMPDDIAVDTFNIGGKVNSNAESETEATTVATTTTLKALPALDPVKGVEDTDEE